MLIEPRLAAPAGGNMSLFSVSQGRGAGGDISFILFL